MTAESFDDAIRTLKSRQPYQPFVIELNGGERVEIDHPRVIVQRESGVAVFLSPGGVPIWFDHNSVLRIHGVPAHMID